VVTGSYGVNIGARTANNETIKITMIANFAFVDFFKSYKKRLLLDFFGFLISTACFSDFVVLLDGSIILFPTYPLVIEVSRGDQVLCR